MVRSPCIERQPSSIQWINVQNRFWSAVVVVGFVCLFFTFSAEAQPDVKASLDCLVNRVITEYVRW